LAFFNSQLFESVLSYYAPRVMGGQFDLSARFVNKIPIPDFISDGAVAPEVTDSLRRIGERICSGSGIDKSGRTDALVAEAYGISLERWPKTED
jgi:hypothetical protein